MKSAILKPDITVPMEVLSRLKELIRQWQEVARGSKGPLHAHCDSEAEDRQTGASGVRTLGHREYVGGIWDRLGQLQFAFLVQEGLRPHHRFLDIGCGSLRAGVYLIPYLDAGHYMGIDQESLLIRRGIAKELGWSLFEAKRPKLVVSSTFEFDGFENRPDFAIAQSLFTHLVPSDIQLCLRRLRTFIADDGRFYATFFESERPTRNPDVSHSHKRFEYTRVEMDRMARKTGWRMEYVGDWQHPREQMMLRFEPA